MIDVHCHLNFKAFSEDVDEVIKRALDAGVKKIINTGTSLESSEKAVELAEKYEELYAIVGIHPHHADKLEDGWESELEKIAKSSKKILAIGEIGLDYYSYASNGIVDPKLQKEIFLRQIQIANEIKIPLQIHNRQAGEDVIKILKQNKDLLQDRPGMFHCFAGTKEVLKEALDLGFCIGFDGNITYPGIAKGETVPLSELANLTPLDRIVTETDSPYLAPQPHRGSRSEPSYVIIVGRKLAEIKAISLEKLEEETEKNTSRIFNI
jgi:TatD DNase family protein